MIWTTIWMISAVAALGDATITSLSLKLSSSIKASSSQISNDSTSLASSLTSTIQYPSSSSKTQSARLDSASTIETQLSLSLSESASSLSKATVISASTPSNSGGHASSSSLSGSSIRASTSSSSNGTTGPFSRGSIKNQLSSSSSGTATSWSTETASSFSVPSTTTSNGTTSVRSASMMTSSSLSNAASSRTTNVIISTRTRSISTQSSATSFNGTSVNGTSDVINLYDPPIPPIPPPATLTNNSAGDVILTLSHDFAVDIADRLSLGTCPAYDPIPSKPIIEKRQIFARNPCAVARSKRGIASIGGGTSLFRALLNLPRAFPTLVSSLEADVQDIISYMKLSLPSWSLVPEPAIDAAAGIFYVLALKHEANIGASIVVNTILHYDIAQMGDPTPTVTSSVISTATSTTQALSQTCPSNTFNDPLPTAVVRFLDIHTFFIYMKADSYSHSAAAPKDATQH